LAGLKTGQFPIQQQEIGTGDFESLQQTAGFGDVLNNDQTRFVLKQQMQCRANLRLIVSYKNAHSASTLYK
jgi:hypothetical protein